MGTLEMMKFFLTRTQNPKYGKGLINLVTYVKRKTLGRKNCEQSKKKIGKNIRCILLSLIYKLLKEREDHQLYRKLKISAEKQMQVPLKHIKGCSI